MSGQNEMYLMKPHYTIGPLELPNVMYKSKQLVNESNSAPPQLDLAARQDAIIAQLDCMLSSVSGSKGQSSNSTERSQVAKDLISTGGPIDIVIHANPTKPPHSLLYIAQKLNHSFRSLIRVHVHSSVSDGNKMLPPSTKPAPHRDYEIIMTVIWSAVPTPKLCVSPANASEIIGESNIVRFFGRLFGLFDTGKSVDTDLLLDLCADQCDVISSPNTNTKDKILASNSLSDLLSKVSTFEMAKVLVASTLQNFDHLPKGDLTLWLNANK